MPKKQTKKFISTKEIVKLENFIDAIELNLDPLTSFILPGGDVWSAYAQMSRAICRRAERRIISFSVEENINPLIITFINRLSDYLFVLARYISKINKAKEIKWNN